ncbi:MAG: Rrf2 family transcriptional regulator [Flavobacteriales bacterium]|nr:Rrf2 family transcriptional regulator [Flavobacteriales bacterium]
MLNMRTKYALHALIALAEVETSPVPAERIAAAAHVPRKFLEAILADLAKAGIIVSRKGRGGGHRLARKPKDIAMTEVIRLFNGAIALVPCVSLNFYETCAECPDEETCAVHDVFLEVRVATVRMLEKATLADLLRRKAKKSGII